VLPEIAVSKISFLLAGYLFVLQKLASCNELELPRSAIKTSKILA
jgi:hypothetical protein